jgi:hypothetical protein
MAVFSFGYKGDVFHLLDLPGQAAAVQEHLRGQTAQKKLAWIAAHGNVSPVSPSPHHVVAAKSQARSLLCT